MKEKMTFTKIADTMYALAGLIFMASIIIGGIGIKVNESFGMIFAHIGVGAFIYICPVGICVWMIADTIDDKLERRNSKSRELK